MVLESVNFMKKFFALVVCISFIQQAVFANSGVPLGVYQIPFILFIIIGETFVFLFLASGLLKERSISQENGTDETVAPKDKVEKKVQKKKNLKKIILWWVFLANIASSTVGFFGEYGIINEKSTFSSWGRPFTELLELKFKEDYQHSLNNGKFPKISDPSEEKDFIIKIELPENYFNSIEVQTVSKDLEWKFAINTTKGRVEYVIRREEDSLFMNFTEEYFLKLAREQLPLLTKIFGLTERGSRHTVAFLLAFFVSILVEWIVYILGCRRYFKIKELFLFTFMMNLMSYFFLGLFVHFDTYGGFFS